jgi:hypothetical protein
MPRRKPPRRLPRNNPFKKSTDETPPDVEAFFCFLRTEGFDGETRVTCILNLRRRDARCVVESCE